MLDADLTKLIAQGAQVLAVEEDLAERGIDHLEMIAGIKTVPRGELARLLDSFETIWHW